MAILFLISSRLSAFIIELYECNGCILQLLQENYFDKAKLSRSYFSIMEAKVTSHEKKL